MKVNIMTEQDIERLAPLQPADWLNIEIKFLEFVISDFAFPVIFSVNNEMVGVGTSIIHENVAWLANIIVHPQHRKKGIGQTITEYLIEEALEMKCQTIYLCATELGRFVYSKLGFVTETHYVFYKNLDIKNHQLCKNIVPYSDKLRKEVLDLDLKCSGENRINSLEGHISKSYLYRNENKTKGVYLPTLGEGLVIATTETAGLELMKWRLNSQTKAVFPIENQSALSFMEQADYHPYLKQDRMRWGPERAHHLSFIYNRVGGYLG